MAGRGLYRLKAVVWAWVGLGYIGMVAFGVGYRMNGCCLGRRRLDGLGAGQV